jgi:hypothetical protein
VMDNFYAMEDPEVIDDHTVIGALRCWIDSQTLVLAAMLLQMLCTAHLRLSWRRHTLHGCRKSSSTSLNATSTRSHSHHIATAHPSSVTAPT